jgi:hypothetical protein
MYNSTVIEPVHARTHKEGLVACVTAQYRGNKVWLIGRHSPEGCGNVDPKKAPFGNQCEAWVWY